MQCCPLEVLLCQLSPKWSVTLSSSSDSTGSPVLWWILPEPDLLPLGFVLICFNWSWTVKTLVHSIWNHPHLPPRPPWWRVMPRDVWFITHPGAVQRHLPVPASQPGAISLHPWGFQLPTSNAGGREKASWCYGIKALILKGLVHILDLITGNSILDVCDPNGHCDKITDRNKFKYMCKYWKGRGLMVQWRLSSSFEGRTQQGEFVAFRKGDKSYSCPLHGSPHL